MNKNRVIIGVTVAVIVALLLSIYVYHAFQQASATKAGFGATSRGGEGAGAARNPPDCLGCSDDFLAGQQSCPRNADADRRRRGPRGDCAARG